MGSNTKIRRAQKGLREAGQEGNSWRVLPGRRLRSEVRASMCELEIATRLGSLGLDDGKPAPSGEEHIPLRSGADDAFATWAETEGTEEHWSIRCTLPDAWELEELAAEAMGAPPPRLIVSLVPHRIEGDEQLVCSLRQFIVAARLVDSDNGAPLADWDASVRARLVYADDGTAVPPSNGEAPLSGELDDKRPVGGFVEFRLRCAAQSYRHGRRKFCVRIEVDALPGSERGCFACSAPIRAVARLPNEAKPVAPASPPVQDSAEPAKAMPPAKRVARPQAESDATEEHQSDGTTTAEQRAATAERRAAVAEAEVQRLRKLLAASEAAEPRQPSLSLPPTLLAGASYEHALQPPPSPPHWAPCAMPCIPPVETIIVEACSSGEEEEDDDDDNDDEWEGEEECAVDALDHFGRPGEGGGCRGVGGERLRAVVRGGVLHQLHENGHLLQAVLAQHRTILFEMGRLRREAAEGSPALGGAAVCA